MGSTIVKFIPSIWWPALDQNPDCMTLRSALVDALEESGDDLAASCMRWSLEKRRVPTTGGWYRLAVEQDAQIPDLLYYSGDGHPDEFTMLRSGHYWSFCRLIWRWSLLTSEQRKECWEWEPTS